MKTYEKCLLCFERQAADACAISRLSSAKTEKVLHAVRQMTESFPLSDPPIVMGAQIHELIRSVSGKKDPYLKVKRESNHLCRECLPILMEDMAWSVSPLRTAVQLAIAGNVIDFGVYSTAQMSKRKILRAIQGGSGERIRGRLKQFERVIRHAKRILYVADNAGECFLDGFLLDLIPGQKVTYAVRGGPILNDATMKDACVAGIHDKCRVIDTGDNAAGILLDRCSNEFREVFEQSDVVIAKGQGNYESLSSGLGRTYVFLLKVKCEVIAGDIGYPVGSSVLKIVDQDIK